MEFHGFREVRHAGIFIRNQTLTSITLHFQENWGMAYTVDSILKAIENGQFLPDVKKNPEWFDHLGTDNHMNAIHTVK